MSFDTKEEGLEAHFAQAGKVESAAVVTDRETGRPRGFGFVEMEDQAGADAAISQFDGVELDGRELKVNIARPREER